MKRKIALILAPLAIAGTLIGATAVTASATATPPSTIYYHS